MEEPRQDYLDYLTPIDIHSQVVDTETIKTTESNIITQISKKTPSTIKPITE